MRFKNSPTLFLQLTGLCMSCERDKSARRRLREVSITLLLVIPTILYYCKALVRMIQKFSTLSIHHVEYAVILGWEFQSIVAIMFIFYWQRTGAVQSIEQAIKQCGVDNKSNYLVSLKIKTDTSRFLKIMASVWLFGVARATGANIERAIGQGIGILDPTMGLHRFDFFYRIIGFYEHLVINCTVCYFASSIRGLTIQLEEFNRDFQELFETPYKLDNLSGQIQAYFTTHKILTQKVKVIDKTFKMFVFCILLTNVPMTVFGAITLVRRESLLAFVFALYDFVFCILQLTAFTIIPAQLYAELHMLPSYIDWASSIWTHFDPHLFQIAKAYIDNVDKLNVGVSFGGLVLIRKSSILMALVLVVPYVILSYQLYVESSRSSQQYNIVTKALNRSSDNHPWFAKSINN